MATLLVLATAVVWGLAHEGEPVQQGAFVRADRQAPSAAEPPGATLVNRLLLVGDAGDPEPAVIAALRQRAGDRADLTDTIFLGDNIYPSGLPPEGDPERSQAEARLDAQIEAATHAGARAWFIPGNHDWDRSGRDGTAAVLRQARYIRAHAGDVARFVPDDAGPGPVCLDRGSMRLIFLDTQWWLQRWVPEEVSDSEFTQRVEACLDGTGPQSGRQTLFLAHHPLLSHGLHGRPLGRFDDYLPFSRLYPRLVDALPFMSVPYARLVGSLVTRQDLAHPLYSHLSDLLLETIGSRRPLAIAGGHDHTLQVLEAASGPRFQLVSGTASGALPVWHGNDTLFSEDAHGFMELDVFSDGSALLRVYTTDGSLRVPFATWLTPREPAGRSARQPGRG